MKRTRHANSGIPDCSSLVGAHGVFVCSFLPFRAGEIDPANLKLPAQEEISKKISVISQTVFVALQNSC